MSASPVLQEGQKPPFVLLEGIPTRQIITEIYPNEHRELRTWHVPTNTRFCCDLLKGEKERLYSNGASTTQLWYRFNRN